MRRRSSARNGAVFPSRRRSNMAVAGRPLAPARKSIRIGQGDIASGFCSRTRSAVGRRRRGRLLGGLFCPTAQARMAKLHGTHARRRAFGSRIMGRLIVRITIHGRLVRLKCICAGCDLVIPRERAAVVQGLRTGYRSLGPYRASDSTSRKSSNTSISERSESKRERQITRAILRLSKRSNTPGLIPGSLSKARSITS